MVPTASLLPHPLSLAIYGDERVDPDLAESVRERGILEPLAILSDGRIVSGHRRWRAALANALEHVPAQVVEFVSDLDEQAAVIEHNRQRVKTLSQRMREADQLESIERERAKQRQRAHGGTAPGRAADSCGKVAGSESGETREKLAAAVGMKARSFAKARTVYQAAQAGSELAAGQMSALDSGETTINAAYQDVRREEALRGDAAGLTDPDLTPALAERTVSALGDLWLLGEHHKLLCGNATDADQVQRLMGQQRAVLMATDPPYLVDYDGGNHPQSWNAAGRRRSSAAKTKHWDAYREPASAVEFYGNFLRVALAEALSERPTIYQFFAVLRVETVFAAWRANQLLAHQVLIWHKSRPVLGRSWYMYDYEPCLVGWISGKQPEPDRRPPANARAVWEVASTAGNEAAISSHPTVKAVELIRRPIAYHTKVGELLYEPFAGSGTCIIAAEMSGRRCYAVEISPLFVDQAVLRWQRFTGQEATLAGDGRSFAALAAARTGTPETSPKGASRGPPPEASP
jgi:DNA modification methylase/ParB-like chromosome segregation protein Spo0J